MELHAYKSEQAREMVIVVADNMIRPGGEPLKACATAIRATAGIASILLPLAPAARSAGTCPDDGGGSPTLIERKAQSSG
ncbi:hypothetical protein [Xanthobacter agilis]|uniref:hypothetical protein n=1 Tax=Xanthobacter agilis TaxID=47492 RepID=UPI00372D30AD